MATDLLAGERVPVDGPVRRPRLSPTAVLVALFGLLGAVRAGWLAEGDTFWEARAGVEILRRHTVFLPDDFSWTVPGRLWHPNSWLFDVLLGGAHLAGGRLGLGLFTLLLVACVGLAAAPTARALGVPAAPLAVTSALAALPLLPWLSTRPQTVSYALLPLVVLVAARAVEARGRRLAAGLVALYALTAGWVNLHLAALGAVPAVAAGLGVLLLVHRRRWRRLLPAGTAVLAAVVAGCASSPFGVGVLASALTTRNASSELIVEWAPLWRTSPTAVFTWLAAAVALGLAVAVLRRRPADRLLPVLVGAIAVLLLLGVGAARFSPMSLILALPVAGAWAADVDWSAGRRRRRAAFLGTGVAAALAVTMAVLAVLRLPSIGEPSPDSYPSAATVAAVPAGCRVLNEYDDGGVLILRRWADGVRVAMDGRNDVYGAALIAHLQGMIAGRPGALAELRRDGVGCLLLDPHRPLVAQARAAGWRTATRDPHRVLLLAPPPNSR